MEDCISAFAQNEDDFYLRQEIQELEESEQYDVYDIVHNYKGVSCPVCNVGFSVGLTEKIYQCPMCTETFKG